MPLMAGKNIKMALTTMRLRRSRSIFSMLGIIIAVASVTTVVSIGDGIKQTVTAQANRYSHNVIAVRPAKLGGNGLLSSLQSSDVAGVLTDQDAKAVSKVAHVVSSVPLSVVGTSAKGDASYNSPVFAVSSDLPEVLNQNLAFGAFYTSKDDVNNVAVLGATAAQRLFDQNVPLGRSFTIRGQQFIVAGVLNSFAATPFSSDTNFNNTIFVPAGSAASLAPSGAPIYEILAKVSSSAALPGANQGIIKALAKLHRGQSDFSVLTPLQRTAETTASFSLINDLVLAAALITLFVSGIGIMNVMLVSITERIHEIGIRKAIGATNRQIRGQFLTEAAAISITGSIIGIIVAVIATIALHLTTSLTPRFDWLVAAESAVVATIFGILFGTLPAMQAARKNPIAALRSE